MQKLFEVKASPTLASGIFPGIPGDGAPLWIDSGNVLFEDGIIKKAPGYTLLASPAARPTGIAQAYAGERRAYLGAGNKAYKYTSLDGLVEIGAVTATNGVWQIVPWGTYALINNTADKPELWQNTGSSAVIADMGFDYCAALGKLNNSVLAFGTSNGGNYIESCAFDDIETWTPASDNTAQLQVIRDLDGRYVAAHPLNDGLAGYTQGVMTMTRFIGGTLYWSTKVVLDDVVGALNQHSVVSTGKMNFGITRNGVFATDGYTASYIDEPAVHGWIKDNVDFGRATEIYGYVDKLNKRIKWFVPLLEGGTTGLWVRYDGTPIWGLDPGDFLGGMRQDVWDDSWQYTETGLYRADRTVYNLDGNAITAFVQSKPLDCGDDQRFKDVAKVELGLEASGTVQLLVGFTDEPDETPTWTHTLTAAKETQIPQNARTQGLFIHLKLQSTAVDVSWKLNSLAIHGTVGGKKNA